MTLLKMYYWSYFEIIKYIFNFLFILNTPTLFKGFLDLINILTYTYGCSAKILWFPLMVTQKSSQDLFCEQ